MRASVNVLVCIAVVLLCAGSCDSVREVKYGVAKNTGVLYPSTGAGVKVVTGEEYLLNASDVQDISRVAFPGAMQTYALADDIQIYTTEQLDLFLTKNWNPRVIEGLGADSTIANEVMAWTHRQGWYGPVGKALYAEGAYNFAITAGNDTLDGLSTFWVVKMTRTPDDTQWIIEPWINFYIGLDETGNHIPQIITGGCDEAVVQAELTSA